MGLEQDIGHGDLVLEIGPRAAVPGIFIGPLISSNERDEQTFFKM
jgi:hypothetical protein